MGEKITLYAVNAAVIRQLQAIGKTTDIRLSKADFRKIMLREGVTSNVTTIWNKWAAFGYQPGLKFNAEETSVYIDDIQTVKDLAKSFEVI